jgi:flagellar biosynthesis/type III secretory pathway protein FliH
MQHLMQKYEEEKRKLNELGQQSLEQGIPLGTNEALQAQSRRVDELINHMYQEKNGIFT